MTQKQTISLAAAITVIVLALGIVLISNAAADESQADTSCPAFKDLAQWQERRQEHKANFEAVKAVLDSGDYQVWLEAVGSDSPMAKEITAEEFSRLLEAHKLMEEARMKMEEANKIREELGLKSGPGKNGRFGKGQCPRIPGMGVSQNGIEN